MINFTGEPDMEIILNPSFSCGCVAEVRQYETTGQPLIETMLIYSVKCTLHLRSPELVTMSGGCLRQASIEPAADIVEVFGPVLNQVHS